MKMRPFGRACAAGLLLLVSAVNAAATEPRRVLLLHSFGPHFAPWYAVAGRFREELIRHSPTAIDLYEASLEMARLPQTPDEKPFVEYLRALFAGRNPDLVVTMGAPAARFIQRYRPQIFPSTPLLIAGADVRTVDDAALTPNDTAVTTALDLPRFIENILQLLPNTTNIAFVIGASPLERFWVEELRHATEPFANRVTFEWFNEMPLDEILTRAAARPPHSAIFYASVRMDARGVPHEEDRVLAKLRGATNAPIFGYVDLDFGHGIVGGPHLSTGEIGRQAASVAVRILAGEVPGNIKTPSIGLEAPVYDWRELERWNISETHLPAGSVVEFRGTAAWQRYRWPLSAVFAALLIQGALISWLLFERHSRRVAQLESRRRSLEVMHLNRTAEAGALSASFAHELSQPLASIMLDAETAERSLLAEPINVDRVRELLCDIRQADQHAAEIVSHVKKLLKRRSEVEAQEFDLNEAIADAMQILSREAKKGNVTLRTIRIKQPVPVRADSVHLQQVILNLARNGMDAMSTMAPQTRMMTIQTALLGETMVEVSISDSGTGIPEHKLSEIFDTFYTTKEQGTGLGLTIARTIVENCGGKIWAENRAGGGAVFRFTLPLTHMKSAHSAVS